jgi:spermidine synthase
VVLVDLDPEMTALGAGNPILRKLNGGAFDDARVVQMQGGGLSGGDRQPVYQETGRIDSRLRLPVTERVADVQLIHIDADRFLSRVWGQWNVVIVDLPDPSSIELVKLYSDGFYRKLRRALADNGIIAVQATSPYHAPESYLCIQRTLEAAGMHTQPYHENVPSFGDWGWILAWKESESRERVVRRAAKMDFPIPTRYLTPAVFQRSLVFGKDALHSDNTDINRLMYPVLLNYYLKESWLSD